MTTKELLEGNALISNYMRWKLSPLASELYSIINDFSLLQSVSEKVSKEVEYVSLKIRTTHKKELQWTASINTIPYVNYGYAKAETPEEALYKIIVKYLKNKK